MRWPLIVVALAAASATPGCLSPGVEVCTTGLVCPPASSCSPDGERCIGTGCGNGDVEEGEVCDDGNRVSGDGCSLDCRSAEECGNGIADREAGEQCDCGTDPDEWPQGCESQNSFVTGLCRPDCRLRCGDGLVNGTEACDPSTTLEQFFCVDLDYDMGTFGCGAQCDFDTSSCERIGWRLLPDKRQPPIVTHDAWYRGDEIWVVGEFDDDPSDGVEARAAAAHFSAGFWTIYDRLFEPKQLPGGGAPARTALRSLTVVDGQVFAVGSQGTIMHFDGQTWTEMDSGVGPEVELQDTWAAGPSDVFACGSEGTLLYFDGSNWSSMAAATSELFYAMWGFAANDVYAVTGGGSVGHYDGTSWSLQATTAQSFSDIWGPAPGQLFAASGTDKPQRLIDGVWTEMSDAPGGLTAVAGSAPDRVFAVGTFGRAFRFDGKRWALMNSDVVNDFFSTLADDGAGGFVAHLSLAAMHCTGLAWADRSINLSQVVFEDVAGSADNVFVAVGHHTIVPGEVEGIVYFLDGNDWVESSPLDAVPLHAVTLVDGVTVAVGDGGKIYRRQDGTWEEMESNTTETLTEVWARTPTDIYAVGTNGILAHYDGTWTTESFAGESLASVHGSANETMLALATGAILRKTQTGWELATQLEDAGGVLDILMVSDTEAYVSTTTGIVRFDGTTWQLADIDGFYTSLTERDGVIYGVGSGLIRRTGIGWEPVRVPTSSLVLGVAGGPSSLALVGQSGILLSLLLN